MQLILTIPQNLPGWKAENMIIISKYNPKWAEEFDSIKSSLQEILGDLALRIDHIGSTSVPGLGAKDVIDIQITVKELDEQIKRNLINAGYNDCGAITHDHIPQGENDNLELWEKFLFNQPEGQRPANIHVRVDGNPNQLYPLLFRDYLRAHPNSAKSIELIKKAIAKRHANDTEAYYAIKDPVYDLIWDAALEWSRYTDWRPA
jgi:GrpB-like predicted nucleotidyltransferase (UPF0157 family)